MRAVCRINAMCSCAEISAREHHTSAFFKFPTTPGHAYLYMERGSWGYCNKFVIPKILVESKKLMFENILYKRRD
jgi:hypothetical protein